MTQEYEDKEREFLVNLKADTGRDLTEWMQAITDAGIDDRNDRIDWFRQQGFIFAWASWMERIHHNGGRPIYLASVPVADDAADTQKGNDVAAGLRSPGERLPLDGEPVAPIVRDAAGTDDGTMADAAPVPAQAPAQPSFDPFAALPRGTIKTDDADKLGQTVARAKAYAPLMTFLLGQIAQRLPDAFAVPGSDFVLLHVSKRKAAPFALIAITQNDLKLGLQLGTWPIQPPMEKLRLQGPAARAGRSLTHMIGLTDARQIEAGLVNLIESAHTRAKSR
ncbi:MAG: hypothetical protein AAFV45_05565 [Pseudomonadota bacterium]